MKKHLLELFFYKMSICICKIIYFTLCSWVSQFTFCEVKKLMMQASLNIFNAFPYI